MPSAAVCHLCKKPEAMLEASDSWCVVKCPLCGEYRISDMAVLVTSAVPAHLLSGMVRNFWEVTGLPFDVRSEHMQSISNLMVLSPLPIPADKDIPAKADLVLRHLQRKTTYPGEYIDIYNVQCYSIAYCKKPQELGYLLDFLKELGYIKFDPCKGSPLSWRITPSGWAYLSGIGADAKDQGFIAMAFRLETSDVLHTDGLTPGIDRAGYKPLRIDRKDHNNRIDDEIVAEIRKSKFVVADLTGKNAGAYFEAGFAMGLGKPVIWTCQQADIDKKDGVHFDTRQYSIVSWEPDKLDDFAKRLTQRIEATIGHGRYVAELTTKEKRA